MTPEEIVAILNKAGHDGNTDWAFHSEYSCYFGKTFVPLSPLSAEIIAKHYHELEVVREFDQEA